MPSVKPGIDGIPASTIPDNPNDFVNWFKSSFLPRWASNADIRNATSGAGISITGTVATPATVSVSTELQALFSQPYVLVGSPVSPAALTGYRSIAAQANVLSLADGGAESTITVGVAANGIGNAQIRQSAGVSVVGNATGATANVADITATVNGQVLTMSGGLLTFGTLSAGSLANIASDTVLGNASGISAAPAALTQAQLTALINVATVSLSGACPVLSGSATTFLNGSGVFSTPAYPAGANPSGAVGLAAVNGSSASFMRADGAPALSQAIAPTWTGAHIWTPGSSVQAQTINAAQNQYGAEIIGNSTVGQSYGQYIRAGTNSIDIPWIVQNQAATTNLGALYGDGHGWMGWNGAANTITFSATGAVVINGSLELATSTDVGFYGTTPVAQRASTSIQHTSNLSTLTTSASWGTADAAAFNQAIASLQEVMNTLHAYGLWSIS